MVLPKLIKKKGGGKTPPHTFPFPSMESLESQIQEHRKEVLKLGSRTDVVWKKNQLGRKEE